VAIVPAHRVIWERKHFDGAGEKEQQIQAHPRGSGANFIKPVGIR
jgi:hypothetical protein